MLFFFPLFAHADDGLFTKIYKDLKIGADEDATTRVSAMLNTEPKTIDTFRKTGIIAEGETRLLNACRLLSEETISEDSSLSSAEDQHRCLEQVQSLWDQEHSYAIREREEYEKANAFERYWDGEVSGKGDFDIQSEMHTTDRQIQGSEASPSDVPKSNASLQDLFRLKVTHYRLPKEGGLPFSASGGCGSGESSFFGGILCLPSFCSDFVCVKVRTISGSQSTSNSGKKRSGTQSLISQSASSFGKKESSAQNLITAGEEITNKMHDTEQKTPTRNTNQANFFTPLFNWDQIIGGEKVHLVAKTPPLFEAFSQPNGSERTKQTTHYALSDDGLFVKSSSSVPPEAPPEGVDGVRKEMREVVQKELQRVRSQDFRLCQQGSAECKSADILQSLLEECDSYTSRSEEGDTSESVLKCIRDGEENAIRKGAESELLNIQQVRKDFYNDAPQQFDMLWGEMIALNTQLKSINLCALRQSKFRCGMPKLDCSFENTL
ncbi:hypothetical protein IPN35_00850 [Candidatus Peregrinibacteria bacterium]|nr:MAG: hypothetical protein IPN35_00850 [Candidatus Peregrinibacteria bacterium]